MQEKIDLDKLTYQELLDIYKTINEFIEYLNSKDLKEDDYNE